MAPREPEGGRAGRLPLLSIWVCGQDAEQGLRCCFRVPTAQRPGSANKAIRMECGVEDRASVGTLAGLFWCRTPGEELRRPTAVSVVERPAASSRGVILSKPGGGGGPRSRGPSPAGAPAICALVLLLRRGLVLTAGDSAAGKRDPKATTMSALPLRRAEGRDARAASSDTSGRDPVCPALLLFLQSRGGTAVAANAAV